jgi:AMMECR1 domain-containing protein
MRVSFNVPRCQSKTAKDRFGLVDSPSGAGKHAYVDELNPDIWNAEILNTQRVIVSFTAIDGCLDLRKSNHEEASRCDGMLTWNRSVLFIELKARKGKNKDWIRDGEKQLRSTIAMFEETDEAKDIHVKRAVVANSKKPQFRTGQMERMERFLAQTGYILRIEKTIKIS